MKTYQVCILVFALLAVFSLRLAQVDTAEQKTGSPTTDTQRAHSMVSPDEVKWVPAPPKLPPGAQFAVLEGDRSKPGVVVHLPSQAARRLQCPATLAFDGREYHGDPGHYAAGHG
jgi:hypothetical protein